MNVINIKKGGDKFCDLFGGINMNGGLDNIKE